MLHLSQLFRESSTTRFAAYSLALLLSVSGMVLAGMSGTAAAQKPASGKAKQGETIFKAQCIGCHNKQPGDTTPFGPPNLHGIIGSTPPMVTPQEATATIKNGKGVMPPFEGKLTTQDISNVVAYLKTQ
jgi:mono/diheme cytochrome c family protein